MNKKSRANRAKGRLTRGGGEEKGKRRTGCEVEEEER